VTWPELIAAISLAADTGMAQPLESGLSTCLVSMALSELMGLDDGQRRRIYQLSMLQHIGCTAAAAETAAVVGDEMVMRAHAATLDFADRQEMFRFMFGHVARTNSMVRRPAALARMMTRGRRITDSVVDVCEAARMLGPRCGYDSSHIDDLTNVYESWDGSGFPGLVAGEAIPVPVRIVQVATLAVAAHRLGGAAAVVELVNARRGRSLAPDAAAALLADPDRALMSLSSTSSMWDAVISAAPPTDDPGPDHVESALRAVADFVDLKSPFLVGHSPGVAQLGEDAAKHCGLNAADQLLVRHAAYVHDIGRIAVSYAVWSRPGPLRPDEREQVRLHPYYTERVLDRTPFLRRLATVAAAHHERLDGSGYFRGSHAATLDRPSRILAAADSFHAMTEARPHRDRLTPEVAAKELRDEADDGRLDRAAVESVIAAAGQPSQRSERRPGGLTAREVEILALVTGGATMRDMAKLLSIAPKTVDGHLQRIYRKIAVSTRTGAVLYAVQHGLVPGGGASAFTEDRENSP
jgi:HD-GYP domain-containing protein (c-di-GMP phosphodiesterase class II)